jgi:deoxyadenosine/deoxycytidine kinase
MICIEGNIGAGKSEVLKVLSLLGLKTRQEPVEAWTILPHFYRNPKFAFALQLQILTSYAVNGDKDTLFERSADSALHVFTKMLHDSGDISTEQFFLLRCIFRDIGHTFPKAIIYLDAAPSVCIERISNRARESESKISIEYLEQIQKSYFDFLDAYEKEGVQIFRIPSIGSVEDIASKVLNIVNSFTNLNKVCGPTMDLNLE